VDDKAIILSDTHLGFRNDSPLWLGVTLKLFQTIVDECSRRNIYQIWHLGDWFHNRKTINLKTIETAYMIADLLKNLEVLLVVGNHDIFYKHQIEPTSLDLYKELKNFRIIKESLVEDNKMFCPWGDKPAEGLKKDYLFGHFEIGGFPMNESYSLPEKNRLKADDFKNFGAVISGHFHMPSSKGNIRYIGAPFQMSFADTGNRGFYIFDNGELEFIEFTDSPKFVILTTEDEFVSEKIANNIVKLVYTEDYGRNENTKILERLQSFSPAYLYVDFSKSMDFDVNRVEEIVDDKQVKDNMTIFFEFIDLVAVPEHLNMKMLKKLIGRFVEEL